METKNRIKTINAALNNNFTPSPKRKSFNKACESRIVLGLNNLRTKYKLGIIQAHPPNKTENKLRQSPIKKQIPATTLKKINCTMINL